MTEYWMKDTMWSKFVNHLALPKGEIELGKVDKILMARYKLEFAGRNESDNRGFRFLYNAHDDSLLALFLMEFT